MTTHSAPAQSKTRPLSYPGRMTSIQFESLGEERGLTLPLNSVISLNWQMRVLELLRSSLVTELAFLLRYNHLTQDIYALPLRLAQFMLHACGQLSYASKLSFHISELGGDLNCSPAMLMQCSDAIHESNHDIRSVILANLRIEQITLQEFKYIFQRAAAEDTSSQPILAQIVEDGGNHIEELVSWLRH